jgi:YegS/Rv2252/BmrU family lipid kinase
VKVLLIFNPRAAHRRAEKLLPEIRKTFQKYDFQFDLYSTEYPGHAVRIVERAVLDDYDGVVAAGGDGTLFEVVNGCYRNPAGHRIPLGVLPTGTGNAFARDLALETGQLEQAVEIIRRDHPRPVDVGRFRIGDDQFYYLNILGLGFVADVTAAAEKLKMFGNLAYTYGVFVRTLFLKSYPLMIEVDGKRLERENIFTEISNTRYTSNFLMAPHAEIDDGKLDLTLLGPLTRRRLLKCFPLIFTGEHIHLPEVETFQAKHIRISTSVPKVLTPDGELVGTTPVEVECLHRDLEVFWQ